MSARIKEADKKRVLDEVTRKRRARKALEALELDNFHEVKSYYLLPRCYVYLLGITLCKTLLHDVLF